MHSKLGPAVVAAVLLAAPCAQSQPAPSGVLTYDAAFFADARPNTAYDMLDRLPGFTFDDGNTARGFAGTAGNVLIDGQRPTSKSDDLQSILLRIPASDVERIDLIRGGAPGIDMQGQTVVANIIRKTGSSTRYVLDVEDNIFQDGHTVPGANLTFTKHSGERTYEASIARYISFDDSVGWGTHTFTDLTNGSVVSQRAHTTGHGSGGGFTGATTLPAYGGTFKANLALQDIPFYSTADYFGAPGNRHISDVSVGRNAELGLHWNGPIGPLDDETLFLERVGFSKDVNASDQLGGDDAIFRASSTTDETILRETVRHPFAGGLTLAGGGEAAYNSLEGVTSFVLNGSSVPLPSATPHVDEKRGEIFGQGNWKLSDQWMFEAGARLEFSTIGERSDTVLSRNFFYPKPRAVLTWTPDAESQLRLRYELAVGQLDFSNFVASGNLGGSGVTAGNSALRPDQHTQYEVSYERHFWGKGAAVLTVLHEQIADVVDLVPVSGPNGVVFDAPGNIGNGRNDQIDLELTLPLDKLGLPNGLFKSTNIFRLSSVRDPVTGENRVISGERPQDIELSLKQDIASLKSTWDVFYYNGWDEKYFRLEQTQHRRLIPPFVGVYWEYKPTPSWSFHVELDNLGRFVYENQYFNYAGPRDVSPLVSIEERAITSQPRLYIQIRKTFG